MATIQFGVTEPASKLDDGCCVESPKGGKEETRISYPSVCFRAEHMPMVKKVIGGMPEVGDTITSTVTFRIKSVSDGQSDYEKRCEMDVVAMDEAAEQGESEGADDAMETEDPKPEKPGMSSTAKSVKY